MTGHLSDNIWGFGSFGGYGVDRQLFVFCADEKNLVLGFRVLYKLDIMYPRRMGNGV